MAPEAVCLTHRVAWFAGKPGSYRSEAVYLTHQVVWFAGKPGSYRERLVTSRCLRYDR